jgi:ABC-type nitrate/sulfonate/bicarbonate transport system substrate-binding protein
MVMLATISRRLLRVAVLAALAGLLPGSPPTEAGHEDGRVLVLAPPLVRADAFWMAQSKGSFAEQQLKVSVRWVASGADALRTFREGRDGRRGFGDFIVLSEVSALDFAQGVDGDFVVIAALARDANGYVGIAKAEIAGAEGLKSKAVATRLGSTSAWLLGEYLRAHGMSERDVTLKNESPEAILSWNPAESPVAAFFVREPYGRRALAAHGDRVRRVTTAAGYGHGYLLVGTWKRYLGEHPGVAERVLRGLDRGRGYAAANRDEVIQFARAMFGGDDMASVESDYASTDRVLGLDRTTFEDFQKLGRWMMEAGLLTVPFAPERLFHAAPLRNSLPERVAREFP